MKKKLLPLILLTLFSLALASVAHAGPLKPALDKLNEATKGTGLSDPNSATADLPTMIALVIRILLSTVGTIFLVLTVYAGVLWMTAAGDDEKISKSKNILNAAIVGLIITMAAYAITYFVTKNLGG